WDYGVRARGEHIVEGRTYDGFDTNERIPLCIATPSNKSSSLAQIYTDTFSRCRIINSIYTSTAINFVCASSTLDDVVAAQSVDFIIHCGAN
ncbi:hypothetical protein SAMN03159304_05532, partial [Pseudomonas sp. NFACC24-1]